MILIKATSAEIAGFIFGFGYVVEFGPKRGAKIKTLPAIKRSWSIKIRFGWENLAVPPATATSSR